MSESKLPGAHENTTLETNQIVTPELTANHDYELFEIWLAEVMSGPKRRAYKIPQRIEALPCGCSRNRTNESDPNNTWHIKKTNNDYIHRECGKKIN